MQQLAAAGLGFPLKAVLSNPRPAPEASHRHGATAAVIGSEMFKMRFLNTDNI